jgi:hypothetical protein
MYMKGTLTNSDILYMVSKSNFESGDLMLIRKLIKGHSKTAKEAFFLEAGLLQTKFMIQKLKLMYLWNLIHTNNDELIKKVYNTQKLIPTKGDWVESVEKDREELGIVETDEEISQMTNLRFKWIVSKAVERTALNTHNGIANDPSRSKSRKLIKQIFGCESYFFHKSFHRSDIELLFALRHYEEEWWTWRKTFHLRTKTTLPAGYARSK